MTNEEKERVAYDIALSCKFCRTPTDYKFDGRRKLWITRCECGKVDYHEPEDVTENIEGLMSKLMKVNKI